ncbi:MAG: hypothetical protein ACHQHP_06190 [Bacteroidia bacterium]
MTLAAAAQNPKGLQRNDSTLKAQAENYVNKTLGPGFAKKNLKFISIEHSSLTVAVYETVTTKNTEGRNTLFVYFKYMSNEIDTSRSVFNKKEILNSIKGNKKCALFIGQKKAIAIAKAAGLKDGIKPWKISFIQVGDARIPKWYIEATYTGSASGGSGECVRVSPVDGTFDKSSWSAMQ